MQIPNEYVALNIAKGYIDDRLQYENTRQILKIKNKNNPGRIYCMVCMALITFGRLLVSFGRHLESYEIVLQRSDRYRDQLST
jgi:hypothetical protein